MRGEVDKGHRGEKECLTLKNVGGNGFSIMIKTTMSHTDSPKVRHERYAQAALKVLGLTRGGIIISALFTEI